MIIVPVSTRRRSLCSRLVPTTPELAAIIELGLNHEEQHQELLLTDAKQVLFANAIDVAYQATAAPPRTRSTVPLEFHFEPAGFAEIGADSNGFAFDNERPRHREWLEAHMLANRLSTNGEYREFIRSGGYSAPHLWLADGWTAVRSRGWNRPLCWSADLEREYTLGGWRPLDEHAPVCHVSLYEAAAFAAWAGARLPTEAEWESRAETHDAGARESARDRLAASGSSHGAACRARAESPPDLGRRLGMVCVGVSTLPSISPAAPARSASTTASSCRTSGSCAAVRA